MADLEFVADFTDLQLMRRELVGVAKDAKQSAGVFEREYNKVERQITRTAKASQQHYNELLKVDRASKSAANSADVFNRELGKQEANLERLRMKFVEGHAAMDIYSKELNDLAVARKNDIITAEQQKEAIDRLNIELANGTIVQRGSQRGMNAMGMAVQQTGYQVGDFLVQIQSGTNAFVAFGQQATQLVGILPMFNPALVGLSAGLGIAIPLVTALGAAFMRTKDEAKDLPSEIDRIDKELRDLVKTKEAFSKGITLDELFASDELERVRDRLQSIREVYQTLSAETVGRSLLGAIPGASILGLDDAASLENLREQEAEALERIAALEEKIAEERQKSFEKQRREAQQQLELSRAILAFGKDSAQVKNLELQQEITNRHRAIDQQVEANELTEAQGIAQKKLVKEMLRSVAAQENAGSLGESFRDIMENISIDNLLSQMDSLNSKLGSAIFGAGTMSARLRGLFDDGVELAERAKIQQDQQRARQEGFRFDKTKTEGGISKTEAFFSGNVGFSNIPKDIDNPVGLPGKKTSGSKKQTPGEKADDYLRKLELEAKYKESIIGLSEREARVQEIIKELKQKELPIDEKRIQNLVDMEEKVRKLTEAEQQREQLMQTVTSNIESAFMSVVDGSKSVEDAFRSMLRNIILAIYEQQVAKPAATGIGNLISTGISALLGPGMTTGTPLTIPSSGVESLLPNFSGGGFTGYGPRSGGMDGKGGMLAMVHPNETVIDHTKGQSMGNVTVVQNFNMSANGDESVKRIIRQETPRIAEQAKAAVVDAKRRGGSYGRSF